MKGADYLVFRSFPNEPAKYRRRTGATWKVGVPDWTYKKANADIPMVLSVGAQRVRLGRKEPYRALQNEAVVIARGTLAELWDTFMDYARML